MWVEQSKQMPLTVFEKHTQNIFSKGAEKLFMTIYDFCPQTRKTLTHTGARVLKCFSIQKYALNQCFTVFVVSEYIIVFQTKDGLGCTDVYPPSGP
ncbi:hypothetical protein [Brevibacillus laterosporus]|uniref:hypothetical protein n=1 Tax=Brevibacillus laterosporus TaxID=1465 RepID=UPI0011C035E9|nr:hypothetical protein [Brevibacillus laterosporus]